MVFASSAVLHDLDVAGELATNMMNEVRQSEERRLERRDSSIPAIPDS
jgi:hypothetical protein